MTRVWIVTYLHATLYDTPRRIGGVFSTEPKAFAYCEALLANLGEECEPWYSPHTIDAYAARST